MEKVRQAFLRRRLYIIGPSLNTHAVSHDSAIIAASAHHLNTYFPPGFMANIGKISRRYLVAVIVV
jgi:hypothetical protein